MTLVRRPERIPPLEDRLLAAYSATRFVVSLAGMEATALIGKRCKALGKLIKGRGYDHGCIVTAYNPFSRTVSARANRSAQAAFKKFLSTQGLDVFPARGEDPTGVWPAEPSWFVPGATFEHADEWTQMLDQHAVVMIDAWGYATLRFHPAHRRAGYVYVVRLSEEVWANKQFRERNAERDRHKPCVYVGSTATSPERRFRQALKGIRAGRRFVTKYGVELMPRYYTKLNPCPTASRESVEEELAARLKKRGFGVWFC